MTTYTIEPLIAAGKANAAALHGLAGQAFAGFEKLVELNIAAGKAVLSDSYTHAQSVLAAKDLQEVAKLQAASVAPLLEKSVSYGRHVYGIATETGSAFTQVAEAKAAETQEQLNAALDKLVKTAPAGADTAIVTVKNVLSATQSAAETAKQSAKKAAELVESNIATVVDTVIENAKARAK